VSGAPPTPVISGVVRDRRGDPVAAARVYVEAAPVPVPDIAALTAADGSFSIGVPVAGRYTLGAAADGWEPARVTVNVAAGVNQVELRLGG
jgi:hypothetical protein